MRVNYLETIDIVYMAINWAGFSVMLGKIVSLPMVALTLYIFSAEWVFKSRDKT